MSDKIEDITTARQRNADALQGEFEWFTKVLDRRLALHFGQEGAVDDPLDLGPPKPVANSELAELVERLNLDAAERLVLVLSLIPHVRPELLDILFVQNKNLDRAFSQFGGRHDNTQKGFIPTGETASFILADGDLSKRFEVMAMFEPEHRFAVDGVLSLQPGQLGEPPLSGPLAISPDWLSRLTTGHTQRPDFNASFPARKITTELTWDDLILGSDTLDEISYIRTWIEQSPTLMEEWGLSRVLKPGYRALFYGPPGTGKSLTATLIGAEAGMDVYRIDLSMVISKYIGETEKNLAAVFDQAERKNWILFFDEADALFSRRTATTSSNDRHANQEVSYLLQRIEDSPQVTILATNMKSNIDDAFARRFQATVYFPMPDAKQRERLWRGMFRGSNHLADDVDLKQLAEDYEIAGGDIVNVVRQAAIAALQSGNNAIAEEDLRGGVARELRKQGKYT